jgi:hypothetical protein
MTVEYADKLLRSAFSGVTRLNGYETFVGRHLRAVETLAADRAALVAERDRLREALYDYANPQHWAIRRNGTRYPDCIWIGPGAESPVPNGPMVARAALAVSTP